MGCFYDMNIEFHLFFRDGDKLYGRGSTDDKGPVLGWLHVIQVSVIFRDYFRDF